MYPKLTKKQKEILEYIKFYQHLNGISPSLMEIQNQFKYAAVSTVHEHIQNLKKKGYVLQEINQARGISVVNPDLGNNIFIDIPIIYALNKHELKSFELNQYIAICKNLVHDKGRFIAIAVTTDEYQNLFISNGDIIVIREDSVFDKKGLYLIETLGKRFYLCQGQGVKKFIAKGATNKTLNFKDFTIKGRIVALVRKYS